MNVSDKAREKLEDANKEIRESIERLKQEVAELNRKIKEKLSEAGEGIKETAEDLGRDIKELTANVKKMVPLGRKGRRLPVRVEKTDVARSDADLWEPPVVELQKAVNRLFEEFFKGFDAMPGPALAEAGLGSFSPHIDVSEDERRIEIVAELPGIDAKDVAVELNGDILTIKGEKKQEKERKSRHFYQVERSYGAFQRSFQLPCEVEADEVEARFRKGVLTIVLPKSRKVLENVHKIEIRAE